MTRGEGEGDNRGQKGKGCQGTWIKDPWTNQSGVRLRLGGGSQWGGEERWGENGDNCT